MYFILFIFFLTQINSEKFCINCKHFKQPLIGDKLFGKCSVFPKKNENKIDYLVSGKPSIEYSFCSTVRKDEDMCGENGKYYVKKCNSLKKILCNKNKEETDI